MFVDQNGEVKISTQETLDKASFFREGLSLVEKNFSFSYLTEKGTFLTDKEYNSATIFREGIAWVVEKNGFPVAINNKGDSLFSLPSCVKALAFSDGLAAVKIDENYFSFWGYVDKKGEFVIPADFVDCMSFSEGLAVASKDQKKGYGYINKKGEFVIEEQFDKASPFNKGLAVVKIGGENSKYGVINTKGEYIVQPTSDMRIEIDGDLIMFRNDDGIGWMDNKGKVIIQPMFESTYFFKDNSLTPAKLLRKNGLILIDKNGKHVMESNYDYLFPAIGKVFPFADGGKLGFLNVRSDVVVNPKFVDMSTDYFALSENYLFVNTDYCDVETIANRLLANCSSDIFYGLSSQTTYSDFKNKYPNYKSYGRISSASISNNLIEGVTVESISCEFLNQLSKSTYNFYDKKYVTEESNQSKIKKITLNLKIYRDSSADNKQILIAKHISDVMAKELGMSKEIVNDSRSNYKAILKNKNMTCQIEASISSRNTVKLTSTFN